MMASSETTLGRRRGENGARSEKDIERRRRRDARKRASEHTAWKMPNTEGYRGERNSQSVPSHLEELYSGRCQSPRQRRPEDHVLRFEEEQRELNREWESCRFPQRGQRHYHPRVPRAPTGFNRRTEAPTRRRRDLDSVSTSASWRRGAFSSSNHQGRRGDDGHARGEGRVGYW